MEAVVFRRLGDIGSDRVPQAKIEGPTTALEGGTYEARKNGWLKVMLAAA